MREPILKSDNSSFELPLLGREDVDEVRAPLETEDLGGLELLLLRRTEEDSRHDILDSLENRLWVLLSQELKIRMLVDITDRVNKVGVEVSEEDVGESQVLHN